MAKILLGVTGGIAAYKAADITGALIKNGHEVQVVMTEAAKKFITPLTLSTLSRNPVYDDASEWTADGVIKHITLAKWADLLVIAPATANTIAKIASGTADNLLTSIALALPITTRFIICPAMNTKMWENTLTQQNIKAINYRIPFGGICSIVIPPVEGLLACGDVGVGKLAPTRDIVEAICSAVV